jgi:hypothetical protein
MLLITFGATMILLESNVKFSLSLDSNIQIFLHRMFPQNKTVKFRTVLKEWRKLSFLDILRLRSSNVTLKIRIICPILIKS